MAVTLWVVQGWVLNDDAVSAWLCLSQDADPWFPATTRL